MSRSSHFISFHFTRSLPPIDFLFATCGFCSFFLFLFVCFHFVIRFLLFISFVSIFAFHVCLISFHFQLHVHSIQFQSSNAVHFMLFQFFFFLFHVMSFHSSVQPSNWPVIQKSFDPSGHTLVYPCIQPSTQPSVHTSMFPSRQPKVLHVSIQTSKSPSFRQSITYSLVFRSVPAARPVSVPGPVSSISYTFMTISASLCMLGHVAFQQGLRFCCDGFLRSFVSSVAFSLQGSNKH